jgi:hypothetical protein
MSDAPSPDPEHPVQRFFGGLLLAVGVLWIALSGSCTLLFVGFSLVSALTHGGGMAELRGSLPLELIVGAIGIAPGLAFFFGGRALLKSARLPK